MKQNLTVKEAAERVGVSEATIYTLCRLKKLKHLRVGAGRGTIRIVPDWLDSLIFDMTVQPAEGAASGASPLLEHADVAAVATGQQT